MELLTETRFSNTRLVLFCGTKSRLLGSSSLDSTEEALAFDASGVGRFSTVVSGCAEDVFSLQDKKLCLEHDSN